MTLYHKDGYEDNYVINEKFDGEIEQLYSCGLDRALAAVGIRLHSYTQFTANATGDQSGGFSMMERGRVVDTRLSCNLHSAV